ncbi:uncharacterized protein PG998_002906 [Apiospora kogelbergensis]|uniref:uncharacterized protein n=1 Tax=Apiospora kogelbergensis TaxID=1337665 RepID=UPI00312CF8F7
MATGNNLPDNTHAFANVSAVQGPAGASIGGGGKDPRKPPNGERPDGHKNDNGQIAPRDDELDDSDAEIANALATLDRYKKRGKKIPQYRPRAPKISTTIAGERRHNPCIGCIRSALASTNHASYCHDNNTDSNGRCFSCIKNNRACERKAPKLMRRVARWLLRQCEVVKRLDPKPASEAAKTNFRTQTRRLETLRATWRGLELINLAGPEHSLHDGDAGDPEAPVDPTPRVQEFANKKSRSRGRQASEPPAKRQKLPDEKPQDGGRSTKGKAKAKGSKPRKGQETQRCEQPAEQRPARANSVPAQGQGQEGRVVKTLEDIKKDLLGKQD